MWSSSEHDSPSHGHCQRANALSVRFCAGRSATPAKMPKRAPVRVRRLAAGPGWARRNQPSWAACARALHAPVRLAVSAHGARGRSPARTLVAPNQRRPDVIDGRLRHRHLLRFSRVRAKSAGDEPHVRTGHGWVTRLGYSLSIEEASVPLPFFGAYRGTVRTRAGSPSCPLPCCSRPSVDTSHRLPR